MLSQRKRGITDATGSEIMIFNLLEFIKKENARKEVANTGISTRNSKKINESYSIPTKVDITITNPSINKFRLSNITVQ